MSNTRSYFIRFGIAITFLSILNSLYVILQAESGISHEESFELLSLSPLCSSSKIGDNENSATTRNPRTKTITEDSVQVEPHMRTLHVIQCLSGSATGFIDEWEVNLKSVLMNAPLDAHMHIHTIADERAAAAVNKKLEIAQLTSTTWRNKLSITVTNVESQIETWVQLLELVLKPEKGTWFDKRIGIGGYFRLLAHDVILNYTSTVDNDDLRMAVYMDSDVVVIAGLNHLISALDNVVAERGQDKNGDPNYPLWTWKENSGFVAMDLVNFERFWSLAKSLKREIKEDPYKKKSDQFIMGKIQQNYTNEVGLMPDNWSVHIGHGYRQYPQSLFDKNKVDAGILHFTGNINNYFSGQGIINNYCRTYGGKGCRQSDLSPGGDMDRMDRTWGRADHYVKLTWDWVKYQGLSKVRLGDIGHSITITKRLM